MGGCFSQESTEQYQLISENSNGQGCVYVCALSCTPPLTYFNPIYTRIRAKSNSISRLSAYFISSPALAKIFLLISQKCLRMLLKAASEQPGAKTMKRLWLTLLSQHCLYCPLHSRTHILSHNPIFCVFIFRMAQEHL